MKRQTLVVLLFMMLISFLVFTPAMERMIFQLRAIGVTLRMIVALEKLPFSM